MPVVDPLQGATFLPAWNDPYQVPQTLQDMYQFLLSRSIPRFVTKAELEAAFPSPVTGQQGFAEGSLWIYSTTWRRAWSAPIDWTGTGVSTPAGVSTTGVQYSVDSLGRVSWTGELSGASTPAENALLLTFPTTIAPAARKAFEIVGLGGSAAVFVGVYGSAGSLNTLTFRRMASGGWGSSGVLGPSLASLSWQRA